MKIGRFKIEQLTEGLFELFRNGAFQKIRDERNRESSGLGETVSRLVGIDPILVRDNNHALLLDTGIGLGLDHRSRHKGTSNIATNLEIFGLNVRDIDYVLLTHLHYDHAAGTTYTNNRFETKAVFPNATLLIQQREWDYAVSKIGLKNTPRDEFGYQIDDLFRLKAENRIQLIKENPREVIPGIMLTWTGGHTAGHQIVKISDSGETAYYLGDLLPSEDHLNRYGMFHQDFDPVQAQQTKKMLLNQAQKERALILFYHSLHNKAGKIEYDNNQKFRLSSIDA